MDNQADTNFKKDIIQNRVYWGCILFIEILSYFFDMTNRCLGVDDLSRPG